MGKPEENQLNFDQTVDRVKKLHAETANQVWNNSKFTRAGGIGGESTPLNEMAWLPANFRDVKNLLAGLQAAQEAQTKAFLGAIAALNQGEAFDVEKLSASIRADVHEALASHLGSLEVTGDVSNLKITTREVDGNGDS